ncbi:glycosyltransferase [Sodalis sp.]|uniref:glycosyltransferase n=1 Tax=Sodalis sp. (in: enterobacteria) TaxID=1898979 RepID=UPI00387399C2
MTMPQGRLKILLLDNGKEWGGGTNSLLELLKRIDRDRFEITCCFYHNYQRDNEETIGDVLNAMGIPTRFIVQRRQPSWAKLSKEILRGLLLFNADWRKRAVRAIDQRWRVAPNARRIADLLRAGKYQLLYMNNQPSSNVEGYLAAESLPVAVVQHCRIEPLLDLQIVARVNRGARCVIAVSDGVRQALVQGGVRPALCQTVFNGIYIHQPLPDGARLRESLGADARTFLFGSIGSLIARKAHDHTLRAFQQAHPDARWKMVLVGSGSEQANLARQAAQLGLGDRVIFTGFQRNAMEYLAAFDTLILNSCAE